MHRVSSLHVWSSEAGVICSAYTCREQHDRSMCARDGFSWENLKIVSYRPAILAHVTFASAIQFGSARTSLLQPLSYRLFGGTYAQRLCLGINGASECVARHLRGDP